MDIKELRGGIDATDDALMSAYVERARLTEQVAAYKREHDLPLLDAGREEAVYNRLINKFGADYMRDIYYLYDGIMNVSKLRQAAASPRKSIEELIGLTPAGRPQPSAGTKVALQGAEGAFSMIAASEMFPQGDLIYKSSFLEVFEAVSGGAADYGVVPIENSNAGSVNEVYDLLAKYGLYIAMAKIQKVEHCLVGKHGARKSDIKRVLSHPQALYQCKGYLYKHGLEAVSRANTAMAASEVAACEDAGAAALASESAARLYGLSVLEKGVQDERNNSTRFIAVSKQNPAFPAANKISLVVTLAHRRGTLSGLLNIIASYRINLTKLESRPIPGSNFEFLFYFDIEGNISCCGVRDMLLDIYGYCEKVLYLGGYEEK